MSAKEGGRGEVEAIALLDRRIAKLRDYSAMLHELDEDTNAEVHRNSQAGEDGTMNSESSAVSPLVIR